MNKSKTDHDSWLDDVASKDISMQHGTIRVFDEPNAQKRKHWLRNRTTFFGLLGLVLLVLGWVAAGQFAPRRINLGDIIISVPRSDQTLRDVIEKQVSDYKLPISYPDGTTQKFSLTDIGLKVDTAATVGIIRHSLHQLPRRIVWWQATPVRLELTSNATKLDSFIAKQTTITIQPATDATLAIKNNSVVITDSTPGKHYGLLGPIDAVTGAASTLQNKPLELRTLSKRPAISSQQLIPYQEKLKSILNQSVAFTIATKTFTASTTDIADWIEITQHENSKKIDISVNSGKVLAYITKISSPYINPPKTQVEFIRDDGTTAILTKGVSGADIVDKSLVAAAVAKDLQNNKPVSTTLSVQYAEFKTVSANTYDKWIEVDLTNKRMYAYEQSTPVKIFLVSAGAPATPTVTGQYGIYSKVAQQDMRGSNVDGSSYFQPHVAWVNYFYGSYAIHGNYWRPLSWFGNYNSSHGCVGLPDSEAQWVYSWAPVGTQVFIHT